MARQRVLLGVVLALGVWGGPPAPGQERLADEYEVKAAFLYNLLRFTEWPAEALPPSTPLAVCVLGGDPFEGALEAALRDKTVQGRALQTRHLHGAPEARRCQVLFVAASERGRTRAILEALRGAPVLTVGESEGFARVGGVINFVVEGGRLRFEVNPDAAERAGLRLSARVLQLARIVR